MMFPAPPGLTSADVGWLNGHLVFAGSPDRFEEPMSPGTSPMHGGPYAPTLREWLIQDRIARSVVYDTRSILPMLATLS